MILFVYRVFDEVIDKEVKSRLGSPIYTAPQILKSDNRNGYTDKCDVWSTGILLFEILYGKLPYDI